MAAPSLADTVNAALAAGNPHAAVDAAMAAVKADDSECVCG